MSRANWSQEALTDVNAQLRVQVCLPAKLVYFNNVDVDRVQNEPPYTNYSPQQLALAPRSLKTVAPANDPRVADNSLVLTEYGMGFGEILVDSGYSDLRDFIHLSDSTLADQPVFDAGVRKPFESYRGIYINLPDPSAGPKGRVRYWFKIPTNLLGKNFSGWFSPLYMESDEVLRSGRPSLGWRIMQGSDIPIGTVSSEAPKMRVSLAKYKPKHIDPSTDYLPAKSTAWAQVKAAGTSQNYVYGFLPRTGESIPACD